MSHDLLVFIIVILGAIFLFGGVRTDAEGRNYFGTGWQGGGALGLIITVLLVLFLLGRL